MCSCNRGHNEVRDDVFTFASAIDGTTELEPLGLIGSQPLLRPADLLTSATSDGRLTAVDVGIISPDAAGAGEDCVTSMTNRKIERYRPFERELEAEGVRYQPAVWSAYGRPSEAALALIRSIARRSARRSGNDNSNAIARRFQDRVGLEIWRRAARMVRACMPLEQEIQITDDSDSEAE